MVQTGFCSPFDRLCFSLEKPSPTCTTEIHFLQLTWVPMLRASNAWPAPPYETSPDENSGHVRKMLLGTIFPESPIRAATSSSAVALLKLASLQGKRSRGTCEKSCLSAPPGIIPLSAPAKESSRGWSENA